ALVTVAHGLLGATKVFGVYEPQFAAPAWHIGPLLNPNNLAGYLNLGIFCGLGLLLIREPVLPPTAVGLGVAMLVGVEVTSASRGGMLTLVLGIALFSVFLWSGARRHRQGFSRSRTLRWMLGSAIGGGALLALLASTTHTWGELDD